MPVDLQHQYSNEGGGGEQTKTFMMILNKLKLFGLHDFHNKNSAPYVLTLA